MAETALKRIRANDIVTSMSVRRPRLKEAETREGMRSLNVWLPDELHRALVMVRAEEGLSTNEVIRAAVRAWLTHRKAAQKRQSEARRKR
jgi:predicted HicB family RNase H-like nuclease